MIIKDESLFEKESFRAKDLGNGVTIVLGKIVGDETGSMLPQRLEFSSEWTDEMKASWYKEHEAQFTSKPEGKSIAGVEIFAAGTWNNDKYTTSDLDEMVRAFNENKKTFRPYLKLGHDDKQKLLQKDGFPAAGWICDLRRVGDKLVADFKDVPEKVFNLIKNGAYKKVSSEIYWNMNINNKVYKKFLSAVALLGADVPAVSTLTDILGFYGLNQFENLKIYTENIDSKDIKTYVIDEKEIKMSKTESEIKLELELKEANAKLATYADKDKKIEALEKKLAELDDANKQCQMSLKEKTAKLTQVELEKAVAEMNVAPSLKPYMLELLSEEKKEYTVGDKKLNKQQLIADILKLHSATNSVNLDESSENGQKEEGSEGELNAKIDKYMAENKCDYVAAYKAVMKEVTK